MKISGSGQIPAGEYNEPISVSGSGRITGSVRCLAFSCSGSATVAGDLHSTGDVSASGSMSVDKSITAKNVSASGSLGIGGDCTAEDRIKASGSLRCGGSLKCAALQISGSVRVEGGAEAEEARIHGSFQCGGLLNAERIEIRLHGESRVGSIGGSEICIFPSERESEKVLRLPLLTKLIGSAARRRHLTVTESIEGDTVAIEEVTAPLVVGKTVSVGAGCTVGLVQYSEEIEIHPDAAVERCEKITDTPG